MGYATISTGSGKHSHHRVIINSKIKFESRGKLVFFLLFHNSFYSFNRQKKIQVNGVRIKNVLTFWPGQKCHSRWRTRRKWHILMAVMRGNRVGGNWLMKWDEVKKIPLYSHRLTHQKRVASELHDSYFHSMTITQAIPKIAEVTHPNRQISEEIAEAWRCVHITAWEFEGNIRPTNWTEGVSWVE